MPSWSPVRRSSPRWNGRQMASEGEWTGTRTTQPGSTTGLRAVDTPDGRIIPSTRSKRRSSSIAKRVQSLDIPRSMERPHDTRIGEQVLERNLDRVETITADDGHDRDELRRKLREAGVRTVIGHRKLSTPAAAHNTGLRRRHVPPQRRCRVGYSIVETTIRRYATSANLVRSVPRTRTRSRHHRYRSHARRLNRSISSR